MKKQHPLILGMGITILCVALMGCEADGGASGEKITPCTASSECAQGLLCVNTLGIGACTPTCEISVDACGGSASCSALGSVSVNVCQEAPANETSGEAKESPKLSCETDADCSIIQEGTICVTFKGHRECTIPCSVETDCDMPDIMGINWDLLTCLPDEAQASRMGCVPDEACFEVIPSPCMDNSMNLGGQELCDPFDLECVENMEENEEEEDLFDDFGF